MMWMFFVLFPLFLCGGLSVVIVGAGPVGLAVAIEAHSIGASVTLIEKRRKYTREQSLFLLEPALKQLQEWGICLPTMCVDDQNLIGLLCIKDLEEGLAKKIGEFDLYCIRGEFTRLHEGKAEVMTEEGLMEIPFDLLVGADGLNSTVREGMKVPCMCYEEAVVSSASISLQRDSKKMENPLAVLYKGLYVKRMITPSGSHIVIQKSSKSPCEIDITDPKEIEKIARAFGWEEEANYIERGEVTIAQKIPIFLQQSTCFSNMCDSIILVGDASAVASFIQGCGVNYGLKTAKIASQFIQKLEEDKFIAYLDFNNRMQEASDELIHNSEYLIYFVNNKE